jgi:UDP-N-acetylmuramoylalanine--D-glutamate ligase
MRQYDFRQKNITILGAGRSGLAAAKVLHELGAIVFVSDQSSLLPSARQELVQRNIPFEEGGHTGRALAAHLIILSPGVSLSAPIVQRARALEIPLWSELELAYRL